MILLLIISMLCLYFKFRFYQNKEEYKRYLDRRKNYIMLREKFIQRYKFLADHQEDISSRLLKYEMISEVKSSLDRRPEELFLRGISSYPQIYSFSFLTESYECPHYIFDEEVVQFFIKFLEDTQFMYGKIVKKEDYKF